jgi:PAS domain-containing protein
MLAKLYLPFLEGVVAMVVVVITDVTERKQAELALLHVAAIVESSDDAIIGKDLNSIGKCKTWRGYCPSGALVRARTGR